MPKAKKAPVSAPNIWAMTYAEGLALEQADRIIRFKAETEAGQRAFAAIGKLYRIIDKNLPKGKFINSVLGDAGIKPGTISNASYGARVFDLVEAGHLTEPEFDQLTFAEVAIIARVITTKSKKQLTPEQAVEIVRQGGDFQADLQAIYDTGLTAAEKKAVEDKIKADKEAAEAEAKLKAEQQAKELEEALKRKKELEEQVAAQNATTPPAVEAPAAPTPAAPATPAAPVAAPTPAPAAEAPAPAAPTAAPEMPTTSEELIALLEEIEESMKALSAEDQGIVGARLCEMASRFVEAGGTVAATK
jgi:hypothetical protein